VNGAQESIPDKPKPHCMGEVTYHLARYGSNAHGMAWQRSIYLPGYGTLVFLPTALVAAMKEQSLAPQLDLMSAEQWKGLFICLLYAGTSTAISMVNKVGQFVDSTAPVLVVVAGKPQPSA
jgi:hypothetical protein